MRLTSNSSSLDPSKSSRPRPPSPGPPLNSCSHTASQGRLWHASPAFPSCLGPGLRHSSGKASSSAHYRNLIWIPRDQEDLVESDSHRGEMLRPAHSWLILAPPERQQSLPASQMSQPCTAGWLVAAGSQFSEHRGQSRFRVGEGRLRAPGIKEGAVGNVQKRDLSLSSSSLCPQGKLQN